MSKKSRERRERWQIIEQQRQLVELKKEGRLFDDIRLIYKIESRDFLRNLESLLDDNTSSPLPEGWSWSDPASFKAAYIFACLRDGHKEFHLMSVFQNTEPIVVLGTTLWNTEVDSTYPIACPLNHLFIEFNNVFISDHGGASEYDIGVYIEYEDDFDEENKSVPPTRLNLYLMYRFSSHEDDTFNFEVVQIDLNEDYQEIARRGMPDVSSNRGEEVRQIVNSALTTIAFMNCHNIELIDHEPDPDTSREYERHFGSPLTKYKTLAIKQTGKRYESGDPQPYQDLIPLHLRRGHFAHYTDDAPLFGKYTGTFWRPATVVGNEKNGVVVKDYKVEAPEEEKQMNDNQPVPSNLTEIFRLTQAAVDEFRARSDETSQSFLELPDSAARLLSLSKAQNVEVEKLIALSQQLKAVDPTTRSLDVSTAVREFLSGDARSLGTCFDALNKQTIEDILKSSTTAADRLDKLQGYLNELGFSIDILKQFARQS